ncbi:MAG: hypothetical protein Fur0041_09420 [Bacteroidia bacterium]
MTGLLLPFLFTLFSEWICFSLATKSELKKNFLPVFLMNLTTWPICTIMYNTTTIPLFIIEAGVYITEAFMIYFWWRFSFLKSVLISSWQNTVSWGLGTLLLYYTSAW